MKKSLEQQEKELQEKRAMFDAERDAWEEQNKFVEFETGYVSTTRGWVAIINVVHVLLACLLLNSTKSTKIVSCYLFKFTNYF